MRRSTGTERRRRSIWCQTISSTQSAARSTGRERASGGSASGAPPTSTGRRMIGFERQLDLEAKIWILSAAVAAVTVLAYLTLVEPLGAGPSVLDVPWWVVAAGF